MNRDLARLIEPRVPPPERRLEVLRKAGEAGLRTGVIIAPVFPALQVRPDVRADMRKIAEALARLDPDHIYGESLHIRGENLRLTEKNLGELVQIDPLFDRFASRVFHEELKRAGLKGVWWPESK
jgi:DNA repair photolyase